MENRFPDKITLSESWLKAIVLGSLWASFEIIIGSFLHNLRMPFAGTFLSAFAVLFLIAFYQIWPQKWILLKAGIICALMKSISPSVVIFGPMVGIFTEALILEIIILLLGRNLFSYIIGGGLAVLSALFHKAVNLILLYSFDLIKVYLNLVNFAAEKLNLPESSSTQFLLLLSLIYLFTGSASAIMGYFIGKRALKINSDKKYYSLNKKDSDKITVTSRFSFALFVVHFIILITGLWFLSQDYVIYLKLIFTSAYISFCFFRYKNLIRRLLKPLFWTQLVVILILATFFLENSKAEFSWSLALESGFTMLLRAIFVISCFSSISREIANPQIKDFLIDKKGVYIKIYHALQIGFQTLPTMIETHSDFKIFIKKPFLYISSIISEADNWLESLKKQLKNNTEPF